MQAHDDVSPQLLDLEARVARGFLDAGKALLEIHDSRRYRERGFNTFESYVRERFSISRAYAHRLVTAAKAVLTIGNTDPTLPVPQRESQIRPLVLLAEKNPEAATAVDPDALTPYVVPEANAPPYPPSLRLPHVVPARKAPDPP